jgi:hypothetical protein
MRINNDLRRARIGRFIASLDMLASLNAVIFGV